MLTYIHSYWAYIVVIVLILAVINAFIGLFKNKEFLSTDFRLGLFTLIVSHIQFLIGVILYISQSRYSNMGEVMKIKEARLLALEHPVMMILAIVFITIGWSKHKKKKADKAKFKTFAIFYGIALLFVLSKIPWNNWF
jgi:NADH:ubiquinone oxidoreductase subunit 2 (subunit N)